jgi:prepilin-type N-terminal cleavage/methylation domain-containing protein/prepilin-type processing-associated H-X9-DG protein
MPATSRSRTAFTLVELLVVIGIIAVLIAILMPALSAARRQALTVSCLSNLRQLDTAFITYQNDNHGQCFAFVDDPQDYWMPTIAPYVGNLNSIRLCPQATDPPPANWGGAFYSWYVYGDYGSYGMNLWVCPERLVDGAGGLQSYTPSGSGYGFDDVQGTISMPSSDSTTVPLFGDCNWVGGWPIDTDQPSSDLNDAGQSNPGNLPRFCTNRHFNVSNVVFLDGHAESVPLAGLWQLKWSQDFVPQTVKIP